jgi:hypothetical protein
MARPSTPGPEGEGLIDELDALFTVFLTFLS